MVLDRGYFYFDYLFLYMNLSSFIVEEPLVVPENFLAIFLLDCFQWCFLKFGSETTFVE